MKEPKQPQNKQLLGYTLTEMAIVLCIMSIILAGIWAYTSSMNNNVKQDKFTQILVTLTNNIRGAYAGKTSFDTTDVPIMMERLVKKGVFPGDMIKTRAGRVVAVSPFGEINGGPSNDYKSIYVCGWKATGSESCFPSTPGTEVPFFAIETLMRKSDCITAALRNSNVTSFPGLVGVYVNGKNMSSDTAPGGVALSLPMNASMAAAACSDPNVNRVDFVYKLVP